jgi:hypothetical protein
LLDPQQEAALPPSLKIGDAAPALVVATLIASTDTAIRDYGYRFGRTQ